MEQLSQQAMGLCAAATEARAPEPMCVGSVVSDSFATTWTAAHRLLCLWDSPGKNTEVGCRALLQGIFPTQGLNLCLLHCRWIFYL